MRQVWLHHIIIVAVAGIVLFTNLGGPRLWDRDEPRNAGCAAEMLERGDAIVPFFNGEMRAHKPVLLYWLIMSAYTVFGVSEFSARFWSALLAAGTAIVTYHIGRRLFNAQVGLWAAVILATSLMFDIAGRAATPDSVLIFFSTLALMVFVLAAFKPDTVRFPSSWPMVALMYAVMGMAVLAKGPVGLVLPTAVIGMFLLIMRLPTDRNDGKNRKWVRLAYGMLRPFAPLHFLRTCWLMRPLTALGIVAAVALPWYIWVGLRTDGEFLRVFFGEHNFGRATTAMEGHNGSPLFYPVAILIGFFPWSVFAGPALIGVVSRIRRGDRWSAGYVFAGCWVGVYVGLFSLAQTKLPSYVTPCYPALALLTGCFIYHWTRGEAAASRLWPRLAFVSLGLVGVAMTIGLPLAARRYLPGDEWLGAIGLILLAGATIGFVFMETARIRFAALSTAATAIVFTTLLFGFVAVCVDRHQQNHLLLAAVTGSSDNPRVGSFGRLEPTWIFYGGQPIDELTLDSPDSPRSDRSPWKPKLRPLAAEYYGDGRDCFIFTTDRHWAELQKALPPQACVVAECPLFLKDDRLLLIGRKDVPFRTASRDSDSAR
ncbi:MAG: glycosyltransferase family 39 protein [Planctomycetes bacterium]|nr:glycosyltransferase family 39 protein [Planctomycetota bacterium]MBL7042257.1 glycosyltransferase family 39 protein [Pirellulaceae bacterium]